MALGVELHQLCGDLTNRTAGFALGVFPVRTTHFGQRGLLSTDIAAEHVQLIHRHKQLIVRPAALGRSVFQHEVLPARGIRAASDGALGHLDETANAVGIVDHQVPWLQGQRIHSIALLGGLAFTRRRRVHAVTRQVRLSEEQQWFKLGISGKRELDARKGRGVIDADGCSRRLIRGGELGRLDASQPALSLQIHADRFGVDTRFLHATKHAAGNCWRRGGKGHPTTSLNAPTNVRHQGADGVQIAVRGGSSFIRKLEHVGGEACVGIRHSHRR